MRCGPVDSNTIRITWSGSTEPPFLIPEPALAHFREALVRGELPPGWDAEIPVFSADAKGIATRVASAKVMNAIAPRLLALTRRLGGPRSVHPRRTRRVR